MSLIPLKQACKTTDDVIHLIKSIFVDISGGISPVSFSIAKEMKRSERGRAADALMLEPNFCGLGVKMPQLVNWLTNKG
jgi:hypothetical protein